MSNFEIKFLSEQSGRKNLKKKNNLKKNTKNIMNTYFAELNNI